LCDTLLFSESGQTDRVAPIELKAGSPDIGRVTRQLQSGAAVIERLVQPCGDLEFYPVLASGSLTMPKMRAMKQRRIRFRGQGYEIIRVKCNSSFDDVVIRYG
jgi:hypothetical protein